jgi:hypothetical protein
MPVKPGRQTVKQILAILHEPRERQQENRKIVGDSPLDKLVKSHGQDPGLVDDIERIDDSPRSHRRELDAVAVPPQALADRQPFLVNPASSGQHQLAYRDDQSINRDRGEIKSLAIAEKQRILDHIRRRPLVTEGLLKARTRPHRPASTFAAGLESTLRQESDQEARAGSSGSGNDRMPPRTHSFASISKLKRTRAPA